MLVKDVRFEVIGPAERVGIVLAIALHAERLYKADADGLSLAFEGVRFY